MPRHVRNPSMSRAISAAAIHASLLAASLLPASASAQALSIRTVALSGQPAPGTAPGATEGTFGATFRVPVINNAGHVAFISALNGVPSASQGIWAETDDGLRLVTRAGLAAPGTSNAILDFPTPQYLNINDSDDILFACNVFNRGLSLIARRDDTPAFVAYPGLAAPGTANTFATIYASSAAFNSSGQVAFYARLAGVSQIDGIWVDDASTLASRVLEGDPTPGLPDFNFFSLVPAPTTRSPSTTRGASLSPPTCAASHATTRPSGAAIHRACSSSSAKTT